MGHKFALRRPIRESLTALIEETHGKYVNRFKHSSKTDVKNFELWKNRLTSEAANTQEGKPPRHCRTIRQGLKDLKAMDVVLKAADKNLGVVVMRRDIYNHLLNKNLAPPSFAKVTSFPHHRILEELRLLLEYKPIPMWQKERWLNEARKAKEACPFYIGPKIHKKQLGARPITPQHSYMLAPLSKHLATVLQEVADQLPVIARDSKTVVQQLEGLQVQGKTFVFMTYDIEKCYPSIDTNDAVQTLYNNMPIMQRNGAILSTLLKFIMDNNYVEANKKVYKQKIGTATGTPVAPPFANLYLYFKYKAALSHHSILFQSRYIDDGLVLIKTEALGKQLIKALGSASNLKLTFDIDTRKAIYLDLEVSKGTRFERQGKVDLKVYFKPTNRLLYLPANSEHPIAHKVGVIRGEAIRLLRNSSDKTAWLNSLSTIFKGLMSRGYTPSQIKTQWSKIRFKDRNEFIFLSRPREKPHGTLVLTRYHPRIRVEWKLLLEKYPLRKYLHIGKIGRYTKKQKAILEDWPPRLIFHEFDKLGRKLYKAKQITENSASSVNNGDAIAPNV